MEAKRHSYDDLQIMAGKCIDEGRGLTDWEQNFVTDIQDQLTNYGQISEKQEEILKRIYDNKTP